MKHVLLIASKGGDRGEEQRIMPYGLMQISNIFKEFHYEVHLIDMELDTEENILNLLSKYKFDIFGFSGISTSFHTVGEISSFIKETINYKTLFISGGPLSSTYDLLIEDDIVDYVFHGEAEINLPKFLQFIEGAGELADIGGLSYRKDKIKTTPSNILYETDILYRTKPEIQIEDLDMRDFPDYSLIDLNKYLFDLNSNVQHLENCFGRDHPIYLRTKQLVDENKTKYIEMHSSIGCTHKCTFCYRHVKGIRRSSVDYFFDQIKKVQETVDIDGVYVCDELFNNDLIWVDEFITKFKMSGLSFFKIGGMRVDKINDQLFKKLSENGCISISFGHESASNMVLKYYKKGITKEKNIEAEKLCRKYNIESTIQLVVGSPVETVESIYETLDFIKETDARIVSTNWIIPLPETPIWKQVTKENKILNSRDFLKTVFYAGPHYSIGNFSPLSDKRLSSIAWMIKRTYLTNRLNANLPISDKDIEYYYINDSSYEEAYNFFVQKGTNK